MRPGDVMADLARLTLADPRRAAARLEAMALPEQAAWLGLGLVAVLWVLLDQLLGLGQMSEVPPWPGAALMANPVTAVPLNAASSLMVALSVVLCGRMFGRRPSVATALTAVLWLQFLLLGAMAASMLAALLLPVAGGLLGMVALVVYLWLLVCFASVLARIDSLVATGLGMILAALIVSLGFGLILSLFIATGLVAIPGVS
jgi:hypothetical protein